MVCLIDSSRLFYVFSVSDSLSVPMYMSQACLELLYQAVHPLESMKPWSSETMTSLATLGKVCARFCFHLIGNNLLNVKCGFTTKYKQTLKQNLKEKSIFFIFLMFLSFSVSYLLSILSSSLRCERVSEFPLPVSFIKNNKYLITLSFNDINDYIMVWAVERGVHGELCSMLSL